MTDILEEKYFLVVHSGQNGKLRDSLPGQDADQSWRKRAEFDPVFEFVHERLAAGSDIPACNLLFKTTDCRKTQNTIETKAPVDRYDRVPFTGRAMQRRSGQGDVIPAAGKRRNSPKPESYKAPMDFSFFSTISLGSPVSGRR